MIAPVVKRRMPGNPKDSKWRSTPNAARKRKRIELTLPEEILEKLERLADGGSKSQVIEDLVAAATESRASRSKK